MNFTVGVAFFYLARRMLLRKDFMTGSLYILINLILGLLSGKETLNTKLLR